MMSARDLRNVSELTRPGNRLQETHRVEHVRLNLHAFGFIERALADGEHFYFFRREQRFELSRRIKILQVADLAQTLKIAFRKDTGLVGNKDRLKVIVQLPQRVGQFPVKVRSLFEEIFA